MRGRRTVSSSGQPSRWSRASCQVSALQDIRSYDTYECGFPNRRRGDLWCGIVCSAKNNRCSAHNPPRRRRTLGMGLSVHRTTASLGHPDTTRATGQQGARCLTTHHRLWCGWREQERVYDRMWQSLQKLRSLEARGYGRAVPTKLLNVGYRTILETLV